MLLTSFLYATQMLATMLGNTYGALDGIVVITLPQVTILDLMLTSVIIARVYEFLLFLIGVAEKGAPFLGVGSS
jgi:hypothetical protein